MARRKAEREALRRERERREAEARAAARRKRLVAYGAGAALAVLAVALVVVLTAGGGNGGDGSAGGGVFPEGGEVAEQTERDVEGAAEAAGCELQASESRGDSDRLHTASAEEDVDYRDNPPTLGRHWPPGFQAEDGLYNSEPPADEALVHTMEHGRVIVWARPALPEEARQTLRALFDEDDYQMVLVPRPNMPHAVAATAWNADPPPNGTGRTLACPGWNDRVVDALRTFRDEHRSNGPEPVP